MDILETIKDTEFLGKEFLIWLWFKSEKKHGLVDLGETGVFELRFSGKITLQSKNEDGGTVICSGVGAGFKEARFALAENKRVAQATIKFIEGDDEFSFVLDSTWLNFRTLRTPKVVQDDKDDPDGLFYEKIGLTEKVVSVIDKIFAYFIKLRISEEWNKKELPAIKKWVKKGGTREEG